MGSNSLRSALAAIEKAVECNDDEWLKLCKELNDLGQELLEVLRQAADTVEQRREKLRAILDLERRLAVFERRKRKAESRLAACEESLKRLVEDEEENLTVRTVQTLRTMFREI